MRSFQTPEAMHGANRGDGIQEPEHDDPERRAWNHQNAMRKCELATASRARRGRRSCLIQWRTIN